MSAAEDDLQLLLARLSDALKGERWEDGISRRQIAERSGLSERFLADVEAMRANPSLKSVVALARAMSLPTVRLLSGELSVDPALLARLRDMSPKEQKLLLDQLEGRGGLGVSRPRRVALLGIRGAGKTTISKLLAKRLDVLAVELDRLIEDSAGLPLAQIFELHGEAYYRRLEREALAGVLSRGTDVVIATGGGLVTNEETYSLLRESTRTIWLKTRPDEYLARVHRQGDRRPFERHPQALSDLKNLLAAREPAYRRAELTIDTTSTAPEQVVKKIASWLARPPKAATAT